MKRRPRQFRQFACEYIAAPDFLFIEGPSNRDGKSMHMIVGFAAGGVLEFTGQLIAYWLLKQFGREFVVAGPCERECNFAVDAFHDKLNYTLAHHSPSIAVVAWTRATPLKSTCTTIESFDFISKVALVKWAFHGLTHAYVDANTGKLQVVLDNLPGQVEFASPRELLGSAATTRCGASRFRGRSREGSAWYGFGVCKGTPAEVIEKLSGHFGVSFGGHTTRRLRACPLS